MAVIPLPELGQDITLVRFTIQTVGSDGTLTASGNVGTITTKLDGFEWNEDDTSEEISPVTSPWRNNVGLQAGWEATCQEILYYGTSNLGTGVGPQLAKLWALRRSSSPIVKIETTDGGNARVGYGRMISHRTGPWQKGKNISELRVLSVAIGGNNPTYNGS